MTTTFSFATIFPWLALLIPFVTIVFGIFQNNRRFDGMDARFDRLEGRMDRMQVDLAHMYHELGRHDQAIDSLKDRQ